MGESENDVRKSAGGDGKIMKARPTEFSGVLFRSKSEAILSKCLIDSGRFAAVEYEPPWLKTESGYIPDFLVTNFWEIDSDLFVGHPLHSVIEYKPSMPTRVYMKELLGHFSSIKNIFSPGILTPACFLLVGSFYENTPNHCWQHMYRDGGPVFVEYPYAWEWIEEHIEDAKEFRYDLES